MLLVDAVYTADGKTVTSLISSIRKSCSYIRAQQVSTISVSSDAAPPISKCITYANATICTIVMSRPEKVKRPVINFIIAFGTDLDVVTIILEALGQA